MKSSILIFTIALFSQGLFSQNFKLSARCQDNQASFMIKNNTSADTDGVIKFIIAVDDVIFMKDSIPNIPPNSIFSKDLPANGEDFEFRIVEAPASTGLNGQKTKLKNCGNMDMDKTFAIAVSGGSMGPGLTLAKHFSPMLTLRLGGNYLPLNFDFDSPYQDSRANIDVKIASAALLLDLYPSKKLKNPFHFTVGGLYNASALTINVQPAEGAYQFGDRTFTAEEIGMLNLEVRPQKINPYGGIGIGRLVSAKRKVGGLFELGVVYMGSPEVDFTSSGIVEPTAEQEPIIERNIKDYQWYPVINVALSVKL